MAKYQEFTFSELLYRKTRFLDNTKKMQVLNNKALAFLEYLLIEKLLLLDGSLRGSEAGDGHAERRAAGVVHADLGAELH